MFACQTAGREGRSPKDGLRLALDKDRNALLSFLETLVIALGLAMDAFSVSMAVAAGGRTARQTFRLSFHFGLFQFFMPLIGGFVGKSLAQPLGAYDHWIAFGVLAFIGGHMIFQSIHEKPERSSADRSKGWSLVFLSTATSIDALGVGFSMGLIATNLLIPCFVIGIVAGALSFVGVKLGRRLSLVFGRAAEAFGGLVLLLIAVKMLAI